MAVEDEGVVTKELRPLQNLAFLSAIAVYKELKVRSLIQRFTKEDRHGCKEKLEGNTWVSCMLSDALRLIQYPMHIYS